MLAHAGWMRVVRPALVIENERVLMPAAIPLGREFLARLTTEQVALRWILGLATALSLWIGGVDWLGAAQYPDARALRIESVPFEERAHPEAKGAQVWIRWLRLENRLPAPEDVISIEGPWDFDRPEHRAVLEDGTNRAALELCGRSLSFSVLKHPWSGALRLYADGELVMTVPLYAETPEFETIVLPPRESNLSAILIALLCVSGLALLIRPWKGERRLPLWLALIVGYPHLMVSLYAPVGTTNDTIGYPGAFESMLQGRPHYFPPGYGALTELMSALPGHTGLYLVALQHLFVVLCVVLLYRCFKGFAGPAWSFAGGLPGRDRLPDGHGGPDSHERHPDLLPPHLLGGHDPEQQARQLHLAGRRARPADRLGRLGARHSCGGPGAARDPRSMAVSR